jgi:hypothetical protein
VEREQHEHPEIVCTKGFAMLVRLHPDGDLAGGTTTVVDSTPAAPVAAPVPAASSDTPAAPTPAAFGDGGGGGYFEKALQRASATAAVDAAAALGQGGTPVPHDPAAPSPAAPAAPQPAVAPPAAPAAPSPVSQAIASLGLDPRAFPDDNAAVQYLTGVAQEYQQLLPYAQLGYQMQPHLDKFQAWMNGQGQPQAQPAAAPAAPAAPQGFNLDEHFKKAWNLPDFDPSWEKLVQFNPQTGLYEGIAPGVPYNIVDGMNKYAMAYKSKQREFMQNPIKQTFEHIKDPILHEVREEIQRQYRTMQAQQENQQFEQQYAKHLYQTDAAGNIVINPMTGQPQPSGFGNRFFHHARALYESGVRDERTLRQYALDQAIGEVMRMQYNQPAAPAAPAQPAAPPAAPPTPAQISQEKTSSFLQNAMNRAGHTPSAAGAAAAPSEPVRFSSFGDLDGLFERAARQRGVIS